jgi:hypothetical protein
LAHEASSLFFSCTILSKAKAFDMCMREGAVVAGVAFDFADLDHFGVEEVVEGKRFDRLAQSDPPTTWKSSDSNGDGIQVNHVSWKIIVLSRKDASGRRYQVHVTSTRLIDEADAKLTFILSTTQ